ncbi:unnamed protein product [Spodoptera exigua]|nr:unnamed protein product [Spodoptera exigua]
MIKKFGKAASFLAAKYGLYEWPYSTSIELKTSMVQSGILEENNSEEQVSEIWIEENSEVILTNEVSQFDKCNKSQIFVDDPYLISDVTVGMEINIDRDEIIMVCTDKHEKSVQCTVTKGGYLQNFAHVFMRGAILTRPSISKTDLHMIKFALEYQMDMLIVNYPRNVETITKIKKTIGTKHKRPLIIAGISTQEGYMNIDEIVKAGKPFYVSGWIFNEILTTGIASTREISDVTNAILKGATGLCLHETTDMNNVFEAIKSLNNLCCNVEPLCTDKSEFWDLMSRYDAMELPGQQLAAANAATPLDHVLNLDIKAPAACTRLTGIIASMGKSTYDVEILEKMIAAGMNIALLNMNFGPREEHTECIKMLRIAAKNYSIKMGKNYPMSIAMRLSGRKIRTGRLAESYGESVELKTGEVVRLTTDETYKDRCSTYTVYVDFMYFAEQMKKGDLILLDNETILLKVEMISTTTLTCRIERGGFLGSFKDVFVPNVVLNMPNYTEKDKLDIEMAIQNQIDIIVASFVNSASCVLELKAILGEKGKKLAVVANIQTIEGFRNFDAILQVADGIMISRQELGSDISPNKLVIAQKNMIARANRVNAPIAVSAHILSSMRDKKIPLRAELLDIANCIIDGVDSLVLCAVTSVGLYPVDTVAAMCATCKEAESCIWTKQVFNDFIDKTPLPCDQATGAAMAGVLAAQRSIAAAIIVVTTSGKSAQTVAKFKPRCPIIAVTRYGLVARQLHLWRGIVPLIYEDEPETDWASDLEKRVNFAIKWSIERGFVRIGDPMVIISGWRQGSGYTNTMRVIYASADAVTVL